MQSDSEKSNINIENIPPLTTQTPSDSMIEIADNMDAEDRDLISVQSDRLLRKYAKAIRQIFLKIKSN